MPYITRSIDVDLNEFDTDDLIDELESRGYRTLRDERLTEPHGNMTLELIEQIYQLRRTGRDYQQELDKLFYLVLEKIV